MNIDVGTLVRYRALEERAMDLELIARSTTDRAVIDENLSEAIMVRGRMLQILRGEEII